MILTKNIFFKNFKKKNKFTKKAKFIERSSSKENHIIKSLTTDINYSYSKKKILNLKIIFRS